MASTPLELSIGPRVRKSPFYLATIEAGACTFTVYNHMYMPTSFGDPNAEYWAIVDGVSLWDVSVERQVEITGPDAIDFVQLLTPRDIEKCPVDRCRYVMLLDEDAGIVNDAVLYRLDHQRFWLSPGDGDVLFWAKGVATASNLNVTIIEPDASPLQLQGPLSPKVAYKLFGNMAVSMGYYHCAEIEIEGIPVVLSRTGWSGELGYEIILQDHTKGSELWNLCMEAGKEFGIKPACPSLARSIEGGMLSYQSDITLNDNPFTLGMERLLDIDKSCNYIGKSALQKMAKTDSERKLVGANFDGDPVIPNEHFMTVKSGGKEVGHATRYVFSPRLGHNIAIVNLAREYAASGTEISIDVGGEWRKATIVSMPWFPPEKVIPAF